MIPDAPTASDDCDRTGVRRIAKALHGNRSAAGCTTGENGESRLQVRVLQVDARGEAPDDRAIATPQERKHGKESGGQKNRAPETRQEKDAAET
ncbi:MAG: hypothetical protein VW405_04675 [Rhodospirillaceae bacterium]